MAACPTRSRPAGAGLLLAGLLLAGCGGPADGPGTTPAAVAPSAASSAAGPSAATAVDPCQVLDAATVSRLTGLEVEDGTTQDVGSSTVCTWAPKDGTAKDAAVLSAQEGPLPAGLGQVADQLRTQFDGKVSPLTVTGADDARYLTGTTSGLRVADVLAARDGRFYQVLVAGPRDAGVHKDGAVKVAEALLKA